MFEPKTPLETLIQAGDVPAVLALLRAETPAQRTAHRAGLVRMVKLLQEARWRPDGGDWGARPTRGQQHSMDTAILLCGTTADVAGAWVDDDVLVSVGTEFRPRSLDGLAGALLKGSPLKIRTVQRLIVAGLAERPDSDDYALGLIALPQATRDAGTLSSMFAADPGLRAVLPRVFDIEGTGDVSLSSSDKYNHASMAWGPILLALVQDGLATRAELLDRTLDALERDWPQYRAGWFSRFHGELAPADDELRARLPRYLALCASRIAPTVTLALAVLKQIDATAPMAGDSLLDALRPVMASAVKAQIEAALKLADRAVAREPRLASQAADVAAIALLHDAAPVQAAVLTRLARWGVDDALQARLDGLAAGLAATNRAALQSLIDHAGVGASEAAAPAAPTRIVAGHGPADPIADDRRVAPIADADELVDCIAHVFEHADDVENFERAVAGLLTTAPRADRALFAPVLKRAARMERLLPRELARLLRFIVSGEATAGSVSVDHRGHRSPLERLLVGRIDDLARMRRSGHPLEPLATPTHRGGYIAAALLARRWQAHVDAGAMPCEHEQVRALLRLAPARSAPAEVRALADAPFVRALRYALHDDIALGGERALLAAAARIRHPGADDPALEAIHPNLGPDGALAARYAWRVRADSHVAQGKTYTHHHFELEVEPRATRPVDYLPAVLRHCMEDVEHRYLRWWSFAGVDAGAIRYLATLLPSDLQGFFAEGAQMVGGNIDWWEAQWQNQAYLEPLLDPATRMGPMACLLLALALAGKEPGQTAVAVDALVHARADGRLDSPQVLGDTLRALLATPLLKAARLHKSLQAALRADPHIDGFVFELLCAVLQARPEDPPRDTAALLELLLELKVAGARNLPPAAYKAISSMKLSGNGRSLQRQLIQP
jgi:hypothetical protein